MVRFFFNKLLKLVIFYKTGSNKTICVDIKLIIRNFN